MCGPSEKLPVEDKDQDDIFEFVNDSVMKGKEQMKEFKKKKALKRIIRRNWMR